MEPVIFPGLQIFPGEQNTKLVVSFPDGTKSNVMMLSDIYRQHILPMDQFKDSIEHMFQHGKDE